MKRRLKMNNRGLSAIVTTILMVGLALVAVGIVWAVIANVIEGQAEALDYDQKCIGIILEMNNLKCDAVNCSFILKRSMGSRGDPISGISVVFSDGSQTSRDTLISGNVGTSVTISGITHELSNPPTKADLRIYMDKEDETKHYCSQAITEDVSA